jgi:hypothetical protein
MDASHAPWFASMLGTFRQAIAAGDFVSRDARDALACVELIDAGYRSAQAGGVAVALSPRPAPALAASALLSPSSSSAA